MVGYVDYDNVPGPFDWIVAVLGFIGFGVAIAQLVRSASALRAAKTSYEETRVNLVSAHTIWAIPELRTHIESLFGLLHQTDRVTADIHLNSFVSLGARVIGLLEMAEADEAPVKSLREAVDAASLARQNLYRTPAGHEPLYEIIPDSVEPLSEAMTELQTWTTKLQHTPTPVPEKKTGRKRDR